jgi:hypothetical protein
MAVTSAASSEMIATSSILTFDLYQIHFKPDVRLNWSLQGTNLMVFHPGITRKPYACISHNGRSVGSGHVMRRLVVDRNRNIVELAILVLGNFVHRCRRPSHI